MKIPIITAIAAAVLLVFAATAAAAEDNEAGTPLRPAEAPGAWTVASGGKDLCVLTLGAGYSVKAPASCGDALPGRPTTWAPTRDGMRLTDASGQAVIAFHRWSNSLFVSRRSGGVDVQLRRGEPNA